MVIEKFLIRGFNDQTVKANYDIVVPPRSKFLKVKILHDGIYAFYEVSTIISGSIGVAEVFMIVNPKDTVPDEDKYEFVDILDFIFEAAGGEGTDAEPTQGIMLLPIYRQKPSV